MTTAPSGTSRRTTLLTWGLVVAALVVGQAIEQHLPDPQDAARAFQRNGSVGTVVPLRIGDLEVTGVTGATSAAGSFGGFKSPGIVIVASFRFTARTETASINSGVLTGAGDHTFTIGPAGSRGGITCIASQPGIPVECSVSVEAPQNALPGATLSLGGSSDDRFDDLAVVDLGISGAEAARWATGTDPVKVPDAHPLGLK